MTRVSVFVLVVALLTAQSENALAQAEDRVIYTSVVNKDGEPVLDLGIKDFIVREDGQAREILNVARDNDPLQIALLVDNSTVMPSNSAVPFWLAVAPTVSTKRDTERGNPSCSSATPNVPIAPGMLFISFRKDGLTCSLHQVSIICI